MGNNEGNKKTKAAKIYCFNSIRKLLSLCWPISYSRSLLKIQLISKFCTISPNSIFQMHPLSLLLTPMRWRKWKECSRFLWAYNDHLSRKGGMSRRRSISVLQAKHSVHSMIHLFAAKHHPENPIVSAWGQKKKKSIAVANAYYEMLATSFNWKHNV